MDLCAKLAVPASLLALARGYGDAAIASAAAVNALAIARGWLGGYASEAVLVRRWSELVAATRRYDLAALRTREEARSVSALLDAVTGRVAFEAGTVPSLVAHGAGLVLVVCLVAVALGPAWVLLGAVAVGLAAPVVWVGHRRLRREQRASFRHFDDAAVGIEVLVDGATELRAHAVEERHARGLLASVRSMAAAERRATTASVLLGLLPLGIALLAMVVPLREYVADAGQVIDIGIVGATALVLALGLLRNLESYARTAPLRRAALRFVARAPAPRALGRHEVDLREDEVRLSRVAFEHEGAGVRTPDAVSFTWKVGEGLALRGDNGSGKTTLALCLLGLLEPTEGTIEWGCLATRDIHWPSARERLVYVPQNPLLVGHQTVAWHLRLLAHHEPSDRELTEALRAVGLWRVLERDGHSEPLDVPVAELSGGERRRLHLARALLGDPALVVLDEPEAGLDRGGRGWLRDFIARLASDRRVLLIAHDESIVPAGFRSMECVRSKETATPDDRGVAHGG